MRPSQFHAGWALRLLLAVVMVSQGISPLCSHARTLEEVKASGELRVCIAPIVPALAAPLDPVCRHDCGFSGPVYREVMAFVNYLGGSVRPVFDRVEWDEQFYDQNGQTVRDAAYTPDLLASGRCDIYPTHVTKREWRSKKMDFAILFPSRMMVIINQSLLDPVKTPADLAGRTAAIEKNTSFHTWILEQNETLFAHNPVTIRLMGLDDALNAVEDGDADFTLVDADIALWEAARSTRHLEVAFPVGSQDEIGWAFAKKDQDLRAAVQDFFDSQAPDEQSELNRIWKEEFGVTLPQFRVLVRATQ